MATVAGEIVQQHSQLLRLALCVEQLAMGLDQAGPAAQAQVAAQDIQGRQSTVEGLMARDPEGEKLQEMLDRVKGYARGVMDTQGKAMQEDLRKQHSTAMAEVTDRFAKLESRVLSDLGKEEEERRSPDIGGIRMSARTGDAQVLRKVASRLTDFEAQVSAQLTTMQQDFDRKLSFLQSGSVAVPVDAQRDQSAAELTHGMQALQYDLGELKDLLNTTRSDTAHVKRIVLACERDMEDFTGAMDAVNVDLDEMRARVDSTHSIITSRQRVEATVTAEISTMRLDMGDMQEALKAHDAWMEDVSQSLQECHERTSSLGQDIITLRDQTHAKLDGKVDVSNAKETEEKLDTGIKTVRDIVSNVRLDVDNRRRKVDEILDEVRKQTMGFEERTTRQLNDLYTKIAEEDQILHHRLDNQTDNHAIIDQKHLETSERLEKLSAKLDSERKLLQEMVGHTEVELRKALDSKMSDMSDKVESSERDQTATTRELRNRLNTVDLRISALQGATGEHKRDIGKMRDEVNTQMVKSAAHDVDISKLSDDVKKSERIRVEDAQRHKQDMDAVYEELDQKLYEKNFLTLEDHVAKLSRGVVKLSQVVGVFPGARMDDGTEEELDIDVELLSWEDCCQHMVARVDKMWKQQSAQKYKSILDLLGKKADHSVLRLLQISQQHIESQLERVRHERELWKEVVDKRAQQPLQLALTLKDQNMMGARGPHMPGGPGGPTSPMDPGAGGKQQTPLMKRMQGPAQPQTTRK
jgi:chromosome segregation ATPase